MNSAAATSKRVAVIIPNWNGAHLLPTCLESLTAQTYRDFEILLVDNGSTDESLALVRKEHPEVRIVEMEENGYFAGAVNEGIRRSDGEIVVLLNNDTEADPKWLERLVGALDRNPWATSAASKLRLFDRRNVIHSAGDYFGRNGLPGNRGVWEEDRGQFDDKIEVFGACGGAAAYRRTLFDEIGLFDEEFVAYCEDVDLNFRAQLRNHRCVFAADAIVYHRLSATGGGPFASYYTGRNFVKVLVKNVPGRFWRRYGFRILAGQMGVTWESLRHIREPAARAKLRGQLVGLAGIPATMKRRKKIQAEITSSLSRIEALLE